MNLSCYQECRSAEGWQPIKVSSQSEEGKTYTVLVNPWGAVDENICECTGYLFRGTCSHQDRAMKTICGWREDKFTLTQTVDERAGMVCPECGGPTKWQMEVAE